LWAAESRGSTVQRGIVSFSDVMWVRDEFARQLRDIPSGQLVRVKIVDNRREHGTVLANGMRSDFRWITSRSI
jgi:hypothetical protein